MRKPRQGGSLTEHEEIERIRREYQRREKEIAPDFYSWGRPVNVFFHTQVVRRCIAALHEAGFFPLNGLRLLDVGCGRGDWLLEFCQWGARPVDLAGIDLDECRIQEARSRLPGSDLRVGDAQNLPWPDGSFGLVAQFTVFTSILHPGVRRRIASEMLRVLTPGGAVLWYDFRYDNPRNPHVRGISAREIRSLFAGCDIRFYSATLAPPLARLVAPRSWPVAVLLECIPLLRTHLIALIRKPHE